VKPNFENDRTERVPATRRGRKALLAVAAAVVFTGIGLQLVPAPPRTNPPVVKEKTIAANVSLTPEVSGVLGRSCANCHSNDTVWPWYSHAAPVSWILGKHVNGARKVMNFSEWPADPADGIADLTAACVDMESGRMPPASYSLIHPESRVSAAEAKTVCAWTRTEVSMLLSGSRNKAQ
jgi:hypothetical protein